MPSFSVGEEVVYEGERYVISAIEGSRGRYRLLATTPAGARIVWAAHGDLAKMARYTTADDDTLRVTRRP